MGAKENTELLRDTLDLLILRAVAGPPLHGYAIAKFILQRSESVLRVEEGALYPALHRLEVKGWLASEWGVSDSNRRAKYYNLTASGRQQLEKELDRWRTVSTAISRVVAAV
jgi:transcriptional regulator